MFRCLPGLDGVTLSLPVSPLNGPYHQGSCTTISPRAMVWTTLLFVNRFKVKGQGFSQTDPDTTSDIMTFTPDNQFPKWHTDTFQQQGVIFSWELEVDPDYNCRNVKDFESDAHKHLHLYFKWQGR